VGAWNLKRDGREWILQRDGTGWPGRGAPLVEERRPALMLLVVVMTF